jgi:Ser/Thr protein kinase RdoA (MazF antagonist)
MDDPKQILAQITPSVKAWDIVPIDIKLASHSENIVYKFTCANGDVYALRIHRPGYHSLQELNAEQMWTEALANAGIDVPVAIPAITGQYFVPVPCNGGMRYAGLIRWLKGEAMVNAASDPSRRRELYTQLGEVCARMHNQAAGWQPPQGYTRPHLNVAGLLGESPFWGQFWLAEALSPSQQKRVIAIRDQLRTQLLAYGEPKATYSMIHADMHHDNVMVDGNHLAVIDFDDAAFGWHQYDLAVALWKVAPTDDFEVLVKAMFEGYRRQRSISTQDVDMLPTFLLVRSLAILGWADARRELGLGDRLTPLVERLLSEAQVLGL